jgi:purine-binding chemotaxis protein CheW
MTTRSPGSVLRLLSFRLGADEYGMDFARVREIVPFVGATWLPGFAVAVRGAVDVHGQAVPAIELATAFGLPAAEATPQSCVLVVEAGRDDEPATVGLIVDGLRGIVEMDRAELASVPSGLGGVGEHLDGVAAHGETAVRVIDLDRLLHANERVRVQSAAGSYRPRSAAAVPAGERCPHLVFAVAGQPLASPLEAIDRIVRIEGMAPMPATQAPLRGVMRLPDIAVAVLDAAALFERVAMAPGAESCVVVVRSDGGAGELAAGLLVDGVERVLELASFEISAPPQAGGLFVSRWIAGMACSSGLVPILDLASLLGSPMARAAMAAASQEIERVGLETAAGGRPSTRSA